MKIDWQWPAVVAYSVTCATVGALVIAGKLHPEAFAALLTWLIPSPWATKPSADGSKPVGFFGS